MKKQTRGFTLIELIVVILILGILAAVAAPKFVNLTGQARGAALEGLRAAVTSSATLANALQAAQNLPGGTGVTVEGLVVSMVNGYPDSTTTGIERAVRFATDTFSTTGAMAFVVTAASDTTKCRFTYAAATTTQPFSVSTIVDKTGC